MNSFKANFCFVDNTGNSIVVGLADNQNETSRYIMFERLKEPSAQDFKFGFQLPHFEIDDQGYSGYGLLEKVVLTDRTLSIWPNAEGRRVLQTTGPIQIAISKEADLNGFEEAMNSIFGDGVFAARQ